jgi:hypothetical protein
LGRQKATFEKISDIVSWIVKKVEKLFGLSSDSDVTTTAAGDTDTSTDAGSATPGVSDLGGDTNTPSGLQSSPKEAKLTNINIKIDTLARFMFTPGTSQEDFVKKVKDVVTATLLGAVNNSQVQTSSGR